MATMVASLSTGTILMMSTLTTAIELATGAVAEQQWRQRSAEVIAPGA